MKNDALIQIYDTTLRDGEQRRGVSLSADDKLRILLLLDDLGVSFVEGGYPASNPKDRSFFEMARQIKLNNARLVAFGATSKIDVKPKEDPMLSYLQASGCKDICIVGKSCLSQVDAVLQVSPEDNLAMISDTLLYVSSWSENLFFSAEHYFDGYREDSAYALNSLRVAAQAGAQCISLCDTNGGMLPHQVFEIVSQTIEALQQEISQGLVLAIHTHNDCGCAVANTLEAVRAGVTCVQGTINGYGERTGNANLITLIANLELKMGRKTSVGEQRLSKLTKISRNVAAIFNLPANPFAPFSGANAFVHKGGLHGAATLKDDQSYAHVNPAKVGNHQHIVVSALSGRSVLASKARELGINMDADDTETLDALNRLKELEARGYTYEAADASLSLLLKGETNEDDNPYFTLESFRVISDKNVLGELLTEATLKIHVGDERFVTTGEGNGPVNALDAALRLAITRFYPQVNDINLIDFKVRVLDESSGTDAVTRVYIESTNGHETWGTMGVSENIVGASWKALVESIVYGLSLTDAQPLHQQ